jgi:hypothetical protein
MPEITISEKFLLDTGGWQEIKHAKALVEMRRVVRFDYSWPVLRGLVREGETEFRAGLKIRSYTDVENLCSCRDSRQWGRICAHSLAIGLALIKSKMPATRESDRTIERVPNLLSQEGANASTTAIHATAFELHIVLGPNIESAWEKGQLVIGFEVVLRGNRHLASALDPDQTFACAQTDLDVLSMGRSFVGGQLPGMTILNRDQFLQLLAVLANHPRITVARNARVTVSGENLLPTLLVKQLEDRGWEIRADLSGLKGRILLGSESAWVWSDHKFQPISSGLPVHYYSVFGSPVLLKEDEGLNFVRYELPKLRGFFKVESQGTFAEAAEPAFADVAVTFDGSLNHLTAKLQFLYGQRVVTAGVAAESIIRDESGRARPRNMVLERECLHRLLDAGFTGPSIIGDYILRGQSAVLNFFASELPTLQKLWRVALSRFRFNQVAAIVFPHRRCSVYFRWGRISRNLRMVVSQSLTRQTWRSSMQYSGIAILVSRVLGATEFKGTKLRTSTQLSRNCRVQRFIAMRNGRIGPDRKEPWRHLSSKRWAP